MNSTKAIAPIANKLSPGTRSHRSVVMSDVPMNSEQRAVTMYRRCVEALHVVERNGRIDHETEQTRANEVPKRDCNEEIDRPLVLCNPDGRTRDAQVFHRLIANHQ